MKRYIDNLKTQAEENPLVAAGIGITLIVAIKGLLQADNDRRNTKTWAREVDRPRMMSAK